MTTDYAGNTKKAKEKETKGEKQPIEPVVTEIVIVKKRSLARRMKDLIVEADLRSVSRYVFLGVLIPAAKNMIFDAGTESLRRVMYRDGQGMQRRGGIGMPGATRYNYQTPVSRPYSGPVGASRYAPALDPGPRIARYNRDDIILVSREDAELVMERMHDVLEQVDVVTLRDLNELINRPTTYVDESWGWVSLLGSNIVQTRDGYLLELPQVQPLK